MKASSNAPWVGAIVLVGAGLVVYSQTVAFAWDEGWHLLAAQLILRGKTPYLDFLHPQTPLNAYWNAAWMNLLGESWRVPHALAAAATTVAVVLMADHLRRRFPIPDWRPAASLFVALAIGLNPLVVTYGTIAQAYGLCLLLSVAAFRATVAAGESDDLAPPFLAGLLAGLSAATSLLTAPLAPIFLAWMAWQRPQRRMAKGAAFLAGSTAAFAPLLRLLALSPRNVLFNVFEYHAFYRGLHWEDATAHNIEVMLSWVDSAHALTLALLAAAAVFFVRSSSEWTRRQRAELHLCLMAAIGLGLFISSVRPTFHRYYLFLVPFLSLPAAAGLYWVAERLGARGRPLRAVLAPAGLLALALGNALYGGRDDLAWKGFDEMLRLVERVTPPNARLLADEPVYFLTRRMPPEGMELDDSHKLELPESLARRLHVVSETSLARRIHAGEFDTVEVDTNQDRIEKLGLARLYRQQAVFDAPGCTVFWDRVPGKPVASVPR